MSFYLTDQQFSCNMVLKDRCRFITGMLRTLSPQGETPSLISSLASVTDNGNPLGGSFFGLICDTAVERVNKGNTHLWEQVRRTLETITVNGANRELTTHLTNTCERGLRLVKAVYLTTMTRTEPENTATAKDTNQFIADITSKLELLKHTGEASGTLVMSEPRPEAAYCLMGELYQNSESKDRIYKAVITRVDMLKQTIGDRENEESM